MEAAPALIVPLGPTWALPLLASSNTTVEPFGTPPLTLTLKAMACVAVAGLGRFEVIVVVVELRFTVCETVGDWLAAKAASPP